MTKLTLAPKMLRTWGHCLTYIEGCANKRTTAEDTGWSCGRPGTLAGEINSVPFCSSDVLRADGIAPPVPASQANTSGKRRTDEVNGASEKEEEDEEDGEDEAELQAQLVSIPNHPCSSSNRRDFLAYSG